MNKEILKNANINNGTAYFRYDKDDRSKVISCCVFGATAWAMGFCPIAYRDTGGSVRRFLDKVLSQEYHDVLDKLERSLLDEVITPAQAKVHLLRTFKDVS